MLHSKDKMHFWQINDLLENVAGDVEAENRIIEMLYGDITTPVFTEDQLDLLEMGFNVKPNKEVPEMSDEIFEWYDRQIRPHRYEEPFEWYDRQIRPHKYE